jgi:hypothetical protein
VTKLQLEADSPGNLERDKTMRKVNQIKAGSDLYALIQRAQMSDLDRQKAIDAVRVAEGFADAMLWVKEKVSAIGTWFLKPSVKH